MAGQTFKIVELVGTSTAGVSEAIQAAVGRAGETLQGLSWFEVQQIRGRIEGDRVAEYQVDLKVGFRLMAADELRHD